MILQIKIRVNKTFNSSPVIYDVSNDLITNSLEIQERADYSFEAGSFKFISDVISSNIPPYSICEVSEDGNKSYYCISSECNAYFTTGKWVHDCTLLALESILEGFVLGTKTWSVNNVNNDLEVANLTTYLLKDNYAGFEFDNTTSNNILTSVNNEYTFPDGTTYYEAFKQIANKNNLRLKLSVYNDSFISATILFQISLKAENEQIYNILNSSGMLNFKMLQNVNDYCKYLLSVGSDVVDRDNKTFFKGLTIRASNGVAIDDDHSEIILPTRIEGITKLIINGYVGVGNVILKTPYWDENYVNTWFDHSDSQFKYTVPRTLYEWRTNGSGSIYWQDLFDYWLKDLGLDNAYFAVKYCTAAGSQDYGKTWAFICDSDGDEFELDQKYHYFTSFDMSKYILEKNEFEAKDVQDQPNYLVYETGGKSITNFNATYKDDFWNIIMNTTERGMFNNNTNYYVEDSKYNNTYYIFYAFSVGNGSSRTTPLNYTFDVECVPIANPLLIDIKNDTPDNEDNYKPLTRTYSMGDNNGLIVDFKSLTNDIDKQNETLGKVEGVIEVDSSKLYTDNEDLYVPIPNDQITFEYKNQTYTFFISSLVKRYTTLKMIYQLNLTKTRYKIADAIGVDYQFNPTYLPLENIVERPLFFEKTVYSFENIIKSSTFLVRLTFGNGTDVYQKLYARPAVMKAKGYWILYFEAMDNIVFDMSTNDVSSNKKSIVNVKYGDDNASCSYLNVEIAYSNVGMTKEQSFMLPNEPRVAQTYSIEVALNKLILKDSREKLTFTIKVNDSLINS